MKFNLVSLFSRIKNIEETILFMQEKDMVKSSFCCSECDILTDDTVKNGSYFYFRCPSCHKKESVRKGTFLYEKVCIFKDFFNWLMSFKCVICYSLYWIKGCDFLVNRTSAWQLFFLSCTSSLQLLNSLWRRLFMRYSINSVG